MADEPVATAATTTLDEVRELIRRKQRGITAFAQDMRAAGIHVGMTFDGMVICVNCGGTWPCEEERNV